MLMIGQVQPTFLKIDNHHNCSLHYQGLLNFLMKGLSCLTSFESNTYSSWNNNRWCSGEAEDGKTFGRSQNNNFACHMGLIKQCAIFCTNDHQSMKVQKANPRRRSLLLKKPFEHLQK